PVLALVVLSLVVPVAVGAAPADDNGAEQDATTGPVRIAWRSWTRETFELATGLRRPVMLYLRAADCRLCLIMEESVLAKEKVVRNVARRVVPVVVDADLRPDLAARYILGTVPTLVFLLPNGEPIYDVDDASSLERVGGYFASADGLNGYIRQVVKYFKVHGRDLARKAREVGELEQKIGDYDPGPVPVEQLEDLLARTREGLDFTHGGYGRGWKFIQDDPVRLFRILASESDQPALRRAVAATAAGMLAGAVHDKVDGGFHHFATTRDWGVPALEKRLLENGRALRLLTSAAALAPEDETIRAALRDTARFILDVLAGEGGALAFSQQGSLGTEDPGSYFQADGAGRLSLRPPALVMRPLGEALAMAAMGLMEAGALLEDDKLEQAGLAAVDYVVDHLYAQGRGVARYLDEEGTPRFRGILADQVAALEALLMAFQVRGLPEDLKKALDIHAFCRANLRRPAGYFIDRVKNAEAVGKMRRPKIHRDLNGRLALASFRLASLTTNPDLRVVGEQALGALRGTIPHMSGAHAAPYAEAVLAASSPLARVVLPFAAGNALRRAALLLPAAGGVVILQGDPEPGSETEAGGAMVCVGDHCVGPVVDPRALAAALKEARRLPSPPGREGDTDGTRQGSEEEG
ncbi:MAG: DUF255 domain-containing protein, partial [Acidobacteria bacterium]|nr:DUF255 domain-containing protein [Acidobacteriota bacterium]